MPGVPIYNSHAKLVGTLRGHTLHQYVQKSRHLSSKIGDQGSWPLDVDVLEKLPGRCSVYITDTEARMLYMAPKGYWNEYGTLVRDEEGISQVFLPVEYFNKVKVAK